MVKGDMCLKIIEKGKPKDVIIKEGEVLVTCWMYCSVNLLRHEWSLQFCIELKAAVKLKPKKTIAWMKLKPMTSAISYEILNIFSM